MKLNQFAKMLCACLGCIGAATLLTAASGPSGFSVRGILPENQVDSRHSYFDLNIPPGDSQTVQIEVSNSEKTEIQIHVELIPASTGRNGIILYNDPDVRDESMTVSITDIARIPEADAVIAPGGAVCVPVDISLPEAPLDGVVLGGLAVTAEYTGREPAAASEKSPGVKIHNHISYVLGLKISQDGPLPQPDFRLLEILPGLADSRSVLSVSLQNPQAVIVKEMAVDARVVRVGDSWPGMELSLPQGEMAPQSTGDFLMEWPQGQLLPGEYRIAFQVEHQGRRWRWDESFTIEEEEAAQINRESLPMPDFREDPGEAGGGAQGGLLFSLSFALLLAALLLLLFLWRRRRK